MKDQNTQNTEAAATEVTAEAVVQKAPLWKRALKWTGYAVGTAAVVAGGLYAYSKYAGHGGEATPAE